MQSAGVEITQYIAYEIDQYAIKASSHNFPDIEHNGDVFKADFSQYRGADFVIGGSPCTYWSIAQSSDKREREPDGNSWVLFQQYVRAIREIQPHYFIYENNKSMSDEIKQAISKELGVKPVLINSARVSAQFRQRYYWVGHLVNGEYEQVAVPQPKDRGIMLSDVLDGVALADKSHAIIGSIGRTTEREYFAKNQGELTAEPIGTMDDGKKAITLKAQYFKSGVANYCADSRSLRGSTGVCEKVGSLSDNNAQSGRIYSIEGKSTTLNAGGGGGGAKTGLYAIPSKLGKEVYIVTDGKITTKKGKTYPVRLADGYYRIRKLSIAECKRLQTVPDSFDLSVISNSQAYKCLGNGWTVEVIAHLIRCALNLKPVKSNLDYWL